MASEIEYSVCLFCEALLVMMRHFISCYSVTMLDIDVLCPGKSYPVGVESCYPALQLASSWFNVAGSWNPHNSSPQ